MTASSTDSHTPRDLKRSLTLRFAGLLFLFVALLGGTYLAVSSAVTAKEYDSIIANLAGRQRMLTHKYAREINQVIVGLAVSDWEMALEMKEHASRTAELYESTHKALLGGGWVEAGEQGRVEIPAIQEAVIIEHLAHLKAEWNELRRNAVQALRCDIPALARNSFVARIQEQTTKAVAEMDHAVTLLQKDSEAKLRRVRSYLATACILGVILFLAIVVFVRARIVVPLAHSMTALETEITERERAEDEIQRLSRRNNQVLDSAGEGIYGLDIRGNTTFVNPAAARMLGWQTEELIGQLQHDILHHTKSDGTPYPREECPIYAAFKDGAVHHVESEVFWRRDGTSFPVEYVSTPIRENKELVGAVVVFQDITERKRAEKELRQAREAAEAANKAKSEFLANMSHEIRTSMAAILGFAENMLDADQPESERLNCIHTIRRNGDYLLGLINDILDLSKIEAGKMSIERGGCQPCRIVAEVASLMRMRADAKGLSFNIEYIGGIPETIRSNSTRLRQILINLIGNAIKFTDVGAVRLVTRCVDDGDKPCLQFDVMDTGRGMTEEQEAKLFRPFMQADASTTRKHGGTGLGLTISKRFAELLGGDIAVVETEVGRGTTVRATVTTGPLEGMRMLEDPMSATLVAEAAHPGARIERSALEGCRILLAEDGTDNQRLISLVLKKAGADVTVEENGKLAVEKALAAMDRRRDGDPERPFDIILMDMQMPVMDGYEATSLLRQKGYTAPIIALTAHAMASDREKCLETGCDDYASKPINRTKLIEMIQQHLVPAEAATPVAT